MAWPKNVLIKTISPIASKSVGVLKPMESGMNSTPPMAGPNAANRSTMPNIGTKKGRWLTASPWRHRRRASISIVAVAVIIGVGSARNAWERLTIRYWDHHHAVTVIDERDLLAGPPSQALANRLRN